MISNDVYNIAVSLLTPSLEEQLGQHLDIPSTSLEPCHRSSTDVEEQEQFTKTSEQSGKNSQLPQMQTTTSNNAPNIPASQLMPSLEELPAQHPEITNQYNTSIPQNTQLFQIQTMISNNVYNIAVSLLTPSLEEQLGHHLDIPSTSLEPSRRPLTDLGKLEQFPKTVEQKLVPKSANKKRRNILYTDQREELEKAFLQNPKLPRKGCSMLADSLRMDKKVVQKWFINRRQKEKRIKPPSAALGTPCSAAGSNGGAKFTIANSRASSPLSPSTSPSHVHTSPTPAVMVNEECPYGNFQKSPDTNFFPNSSNPAMVVNQECPDVNFQKSPDTNFLPNSSNPAMVVNQECPYVNFQKSPDTNFLPNSSNPAMVVNQECPYINFQKCPDTNFLPNSSSPDMVVNQELPRANFYIDHYLD